MPTFCRHNRFIERCPICSKTLQGNEPPSPTAHRPRSSAASHAGAARSVRRHGLRVRREGRASEDGYRNELVPGLHASADAERLAREIDFASGRLTALALEPPGLYADALEQARTDRERASWTCFLLAYVTPREGPEPFVEIQHVLDLAPTPRSLPEELGSLLDSLELGPRSSHQPGRGAQTLLAYRQWVSRMGGTGGEQVEAFIGDRDWEPRRRFGRLFERLVLPGLSRAARFELLLVMGQLELYELVPDSLHLIGGGPAGGEDGATLAAKRVFGIADPLLLDRRATALAETIGVPLGALDLALANWSAPQRATMGFGGIDPGELPESRGAALALGV